MRIFKLYSLVDEYASIDFGDFEEKMGDILNCLTGVSALDGNSFEWDLQDDTESIKGDAPFYLGSFPIFEKRKAEGFSFPGAETAIFQVGQAEYVAVAAPVLSGEIIDKEESDLNLFSNGMIMSVWKYALNGSLPYPPIFRIEEYPYDTFVSEEIKTGLEGLGFTQLCFEECDLI